MARKKAILDRRSQIIQAADQLFSYFSYEKTTMEDISREAGIPRATIYLEFPGGKEDILMANIGLYLAELLEGMRALIRQSRSTRLEALKEAILYLLLSAYDKSRQQCDPNNIQRYSKRVREEMGWYFDERQKLIAEALKQAAMAGEISLSQNYEEIARMICYGIQSFLPSAGLNLDRETLNRDAQMFFSLLLSGLRRQRNMGAV